VIAELPAHLLLELAEVLGDLSLEAAWHLAVLQVEPAGVRGDDETGGDGKTQVGHLGQVGALAAQQVLQVLVALGEVVDELRHCDALLEIATRPAQRPWRRAARYSSGLAALNSEPIDPLLVLVRRSAEAR